VTWIQAWTTNRALQALWEHLSCYCLHNQLRFCLFGHCWLSCLIKFRDMLNNIDKEIKRVSLKNAKLKWVKMKNFRKIAKLRCREICEPQNREINVSRKFHVIRYDMCIIDSVNHIFFFVWWVSSISSCNILVHYSEFEITYFDFYTCSFYMRKNQNILLISNHIME